MDTAVPNSRDSAVEKDHLQTSSQDSLSRHDVALQRIDEEAGPEKNKLNVAVQSPAEDVPPNGGYGWVCVACTFLINAHTWGLNSSYGVFLAHYISTKTFPGATRLDYAFVGGLSISCAMLVAPLVNMVTRRFGTRTSLLVGVFFEALSLISASFAKQIWQLFLSQGACFGVGMGFLFAASVGVTPQWFTTRRSLANGICASGSGFGGLIYSLSANAAIQSIGLAWALRILGILALVVNFTCSCLMRDRNKQVGSQQRAFDVSLFRRPEFCLVQAWGVFSMLGYVVLLFSLPNYANSIGLTAHQGSVVGAILNLGQAIGRPPIGYFSDTVGRLNMAMLATFLAGFFSLTIWTSANSFGVLILFAIVGGAFAGTYWACIAPVTAEVLGLQSLPSALSITWLVLVLPTTFSEPIALEIVQHSPIQYLGTELFAGLMYLAATLCLLFLRAWKIGESQRQAFTIKEEEKSGVTDWSQTSSADDADLKPKAFVRRMIAWKKV